MSDHVDPYRVYLHDPISIKLPLEKCGHPPLGNFYPGEVERGNVQAEIARLLRAFGADIWYGRQHLAPSPTWRDELATRSNQIPSLPRFVVRAHLFEKRGHSPGRYLGFVSLRPSGAAIHDRPEGDAVGFAFRYVLDAELTIPTHLHRPRYHVLTTTASSARLGVLPFRSAVYSAAGASEHQRRSNCVHLAVSQALHLIMGRFPCRPISQIEFNWHLWKISKGKNLSIGATADRGATLIEALQVIRTSCNAGGFVMSIEPRDNADHADEKMRYCLSQRERRLALRYLTDALACGLPVIALVRAGEMLPREVDAAAPRKEADLPHAVLVLGMHLLHSNHELAGDHFQQGDEPREDRAELPGRLVLHDTLARGPYDEQRTHEFFDSAEKAYRPRSISGDTGVEEAPDGDGVRQSPGLHFLVIGPQGLQLGHGLVCTAVEAALKASLREYGPRGSKPAVVGYERECQSLKAYLVARNVDFSYAKTSDNWRLVCRLLSGSEIRAKYSPDAIASLISQFGTLNDLPDGYYWAVEVRHPAASGDGSSSLDLSPAFVHIWNSAATPKVVDDPASQNSKTVVAPQQEVILRFCETP